MLHCHKIQHEFNNYHPNPDAYYVLNSYQQQLIQKQIKDYVRECSWLLQNVSAMLHTSKVQTHISKKPDWLILDIVLYF